ncbi:glycosyltransferase family 61 protein [Gemmobacter serpentinus]|uniref:glycosyltransferase family 61 protein n=1 Tax=Gemmobacter serpentinus TaxID=2652247 RepID=UPI00124EABAD|nr:glycosyltransferase family 61 protein [Gemmobacter serpentinus]
MQEGRIESTTEIVRSLLASDPDLSVLWLGGGREVQPYRDHPGRLTVLGGYPPAAWASRDFRFRQVASQAELLQALEQEVGRGPAYDLVFVDHDHRLMALYDQIRLVQPLMRPEALWLFDDALPPDYRMASPEPAGGWWTGQVCYLRELLFAEGPEALLECVASAATGLLLGSRIALPPREAFEARRGAAPQSAADLQLLTRPVAWSSIESRVQAVLMQRRTAGLLPVRSADPEAHAIETRIIDPMVRLERRAPAFICMAHPEDTELPGVERLLQTARRVHEKRIQTYADVITVGYDQLLSGSDLIPRYLESGPATLQRMAQAHGSHGNADTGLLLHNNTLMLERNRLDAALPVPGHTFLATPDEPLNYGMWLLLALPAAQEFLDHRDRYDRFMCYCDRPWQKAMLAAIGIDPADILSHDVKRAYALERVSMIRCSFRDLYVTESEKQVFARLATRLAGETLPGDETASGQAGRRIFLSRLAHTRSGSYRGLMNEEELIAGLRGLDFEIIDPETLPFAEQIRLMRAADVVVGLGGAGMFNAVFCRPGTKLVDIESGMVFADAHCNLFASMGLDYAVIFGEEDASDPRPSQKRWRLDIPRALEAITTMIAAPQAEAAQPGT